MRESLEYAAAWTGIRLLGLLPRPAARFVGASFAAAAYAIRTPLRRAAMFNLRLAFPDWTDAQRRRAEPQPERGQLLIESRLADQIMLSSRGGERNKPGKRGCRSAIAAKELRPRHLLADFGDLSECVAELHAGPDGPAD